MTFFYDLNKRLAGLAGKQELTEGKKPDFLDVDKDGNKKESFKQAVKDAEAKKVDETFQGTPSGGEFQVEEEGGIPVTPKQKKFAKLAPPADKITFADKIVGAKKEVDEMLGDVAAEAIKKAVKSNKPKNVFDPEVARAMFAPEKGKTKTGHEVKDTGYSKRYTKKLDDEPETDDEANDEPKKKGRKAVGAGKGKKLGAKSHGTSKLARKDSIKEGDAECCPHCGHELVSEKAVSQQQQKFMGMAHAMQKGEKVKGASPELKKVAKTMKKSDVTDFAKTKRSNLPKKVKDGEAVKEEDQESPKSKKGGMQFGKGVYEAMNDNLESLITESMNVNVSMSTNDMGEPTKSITVSAEGEQAEMLAQLLNLAGLQGQQEQVDEVDENNPDWPTDAETTGNDDPNLTRWAGGLNKPKETGQTTAPVVNRDPARGSIGPGKMAENVDLGLNLYAELKSFKNNK